MLYDYAVLALKNLTRSRLRSILTMIGIFIGIAAVVSLVSISQGLKDSINEQFEKIGADKIFISIKNSNFGMFSDLSSARLTTADVDEVKHTPGVRLVMGMLFKSAKVDVGREQGVYYAISIPDDAEEREMWKVINSVTIGQGKMIRKNDANHVIIGADIAKPGAFDKAVTVGTKMLVNGREFDVGGILKKVGDPGTDGGVWMSESVMRELYNDPDTQGTLIVQTAPGVDPLKVGDDIKRGLRSFRGLKKGQEDFDIQTPNDILQTLNTILNIIQAVLVGVSIISLVVGGIGIMNTMYTAVMERTTEIGVMKAIGARNRDIMSIFVFEAGFLGVVGGIIGVLLGAGIAQTVAIIARYALSTDYLKIYFPWYLIIGALGFAFVIGTISGVLPAYQASKMPPVEALRYE